MFAQEPDIKSGGDGGRKQHAEGARRINRQQGDGAFRKQQHGAAEQNIAGV